MPGLMQKPSALYYTESYQSQQWTELPGQALDRTVYESSCLFVYLPSSAWQWWVLEYDFRGRVCPLYCMDPSHYRTSLRPSAKSQRKPSADNLLFTSLWDIYPYTTVVECILVCVETSEFPIRLLLLHIPIHRRILLVSEDDRFARLALS